MVHELLTFPKGQHDDQVDSTALALDWFRQRASEPAMLAYYRELVEDRERRGLR